MGDQYQWWQSILYNSGSFVCPSKGLTILKGKANWVGLPKGPLKYTNSPTRRGGKKKGSKTPSSTIVTEPAREPATTWDNTFLDPPSLLDAKFPARDMRFTKKGQA